MKVIIMVCSKKNLFRTNGPFLWLKMANPDNSWSAQRILLKFSRMKGADRFMKILLLFEKKFHLAQFDLFSLEAIFYSDWAWLKLSQVTATIGSLNSEDRITFMISAGSLNSQDMIRILKQSRHDFSGKHLYDGYCMDIMCCLCVEVKIHGFVKLL